MSKVSWAEATTLYDEFGSFNSYKAAQSMTLVIVFEARRQEQENYDSIKALAIISLFQAVQFKQAKNYWHNVQNNKFGQ